MNTIKTIAFATLGCKLNFSETSTLSRSFSDKGFTVINFKETADIYVINTCTVTENAEKKCKAEIKSAAKRNPNAIIAVTGCYSQLRAEKIASIPGVSIVTGTTDKFQLIELIEEYLQHGKLIVKTNKTNADFAPSYSINDRTRSFFKIQDGCDYHCNYCTIPLARGKSRSNTIEKTMKIAKEIAASEIKEIVLTGVNIGDFGKRNKESLYKLLIQLEKLEGIERIRISSIEPDLLTDEIIELLAKSKKILPHLHIPLQSGSDKILKAMHRRYNTILFKQKTEFILSRIPNCFIAIDLIVGFPGESVEDFENTLRFIESIPLAFMHIFPYSERPDTPSILLENKVPTSIIKQRCKLLKEICNIKKTTFYESNTNFFAKVLFESNNDHGWMTGFTENYVKVKIPYDTKYINQIISVKLNQLEKDCIFAGEVL